MESYSARVNLPHLAALKNLLIYGNILELKDYLLHTIFVQVVADCKNLLQQVERSSTDLQ